MFKYYLNHTNTGFGDMVSTEIKSEPKVKKKSHWAGGRIAAKFIAHSSRFMNNDGKESTED